MQTVLDVVKNVLTILKNTVGLRDILDIALVAYVIYAVIMLCRKTRAVQLVRGILILLVASLLTSELGLKTMDFLLGKVLQFGILAIIVVFQPELRRALEQVGRSNPGLRQLFSGKVAPESISLWRDVSVSICDSAERMAKDRTGALIVIERKTGLNEIELTGTRVDAVLTSELLETIFYEGSPLHDGAVLVRDGRVCAAGCILPVSHNNEISRDMGTRHRAALGMSESSDALVVVVSEESGIISVAQDGVILRRLDRTKLLRILQKELVPTDDPETASGGIFGKAVKK